MGPGLGVAGPRRIVSPLTSGAILFHPFQVFKFVPHGNIGFWLQDFRYCREAFTSYLPSTKVTVGSSVGWHQRNNLPDDPLFHGRSFRRSQSYKHGGHLSGDFYNSHTCFNLVDPSNTILNSRRVGRHIGQPGSTKLNGSSRIVSVDYHVGQMDVGTTSKLNGEIFILKI